MLIYIRKINRNDAVDIAFTERANYPEIRTLIDDHKLLLSSLPKESFKKK